MNKLITLIAVPYDSGHFNERMGAGPLSIINSGLIEELNDAGFDVGYKEIRLEETFPTEIASLFKLLSKVKSEVIASVNNDSFPIVLSGNCCATVGVVASQHENDEGVIWFDAHGDCEIPETTKSGFLDGMGLSMLLHSCWQNMLSSFHLCPRMLGSNIVLLGTRDLSQSERAFISKNGINHVTVNHIQHSKDAVILTICSNLQDRGVKKLHVHFDVDVIDPSIAPSNSYSVGNGLTKEEVLESIRLFMSVIPVVSLTIASYDPSLDKQRQMLTIIQEVIEVIVKS